MSNIDIVCTKLLAFRNVSGFEHCKIQDVLFDVITTVPITMEKFVAVLIVSLQRVRSITDIQERKIANKFEGRCIYSFLFHKI